MKTNKQLEEEIKKIKDKLQFYKNGYSGTLQQFIQKDKEVDILYKLSKELIDTLIKAQGLINTQDIRYQLCKNENFRLKEELKNNKTFWKKLFSIL